MKLGKLGAWAPTENLTAPESAAFAQRLEQWGYAALWQPEGIGRNPLVQCAWLLAHTTKLVVATGVANIYARDAQAMAGGQYALAEQSGGRFLLGIGVSHAPLVTGWRGHAYEKPIATMRAYLEAMRAFQYSPPAPPEKPLTVIGALGPKMLALSRDLADGAHPYNVTPEHTREARAILGAGKLLCVEQKTLLTTDAAQARAIGRRMLGMYLGLENYVNNWLRLGFTAADMENGGSDRLIDAMFAWGDERGIMARVQAHWDAGADHVCIQALPTEGEGLVDEAAFKALALTGA